LASAPTPNVAAQFAWLARPEGLDFFTAELCPLIGLEYSQPIFVSTCFLEDKMT
jgi:hypothetical protein